MSRASDHAFAQIRAMILSGELAPGMQLSEEGLALRCQVSRTPVREAMRRLETDHLLRRSESQRTFVADWSLDDIADAFELRAMLEAMAARRTAERIDGAAIARLKAVNQAIRRAVAKPRPDVDAFLDHNRAFHAAIVEIAGSPRLASILGHLIEQPVVLRTAQNYGRADLMESYQEHEALIGAFARADRDWAGAIMSGHIRRAYYAYVDAHRASLGEGRRSIA